MDPAYAIETTALRKSFGDVEVLRGVDLQVKKGTMLALLGPNGAGKTTTVRILSTLLSYTTGMAKVAGYDVARQSTAVQRVIGVTGQQTAVDGLLTGYENLVMMGRLFRLSSAAARQRATDLLAKFDLTDAGNRQVKTYSGGMQRKLDLAISLIAAPEVLFLDEPTTGLDPRSRSAVWDAIRALLTDGVTVLLTTQYLDEADQLAHHIAVIDGGRVVAEGSPEQLKQQVGTERLELTFADTAVLAKAAIVLNINSSSQKQQAVSIPIDGPQDVKQILDDLAQAHIAPVSLSLTKPTLDDVFLALTGQPTHLAASVGENAHA